MGDPREERGRDGQHEHDEDDHDPGERPPVFPELTPEDLPRGAPDDLSRRSRVRRLPGPRFGRRVLLLRGRPRRPVAFSYQGSHVRSIPPARQSSGGCYGRKPQSAPQGGQEPISAVRRGRISTPRSSPRAPSAHARSPNAVEPSGLHAAAAHHQRAPDRPCGPCARTTSSGRAVTATIVRREVDRAEHLGEEPGVDRRDHVALVLGTAVVRGHVGSLDVDVERVVPGERLRGQARPVRVLLRRRRPSARRCPGGARRRGASRASSRCRAPRASRRSTPTRGRTGR